MISSTSVDYYFYQSSGSNIERCVDMTVSAAQFDGIKPINRRLFISVQAPWRRHVSSLVWNQDKKRRGIDLTRYFAEFIAVIVRRISSADRLTIWS